MRFSGILCNLPTSGWKRVSTVPVRRSLTLGAGTRKMAQHGATVFVDQTHTPELPSWPLPCCRTSTTTSLSFPWAHRRLHGFPKTTVSYRNDDGDVYYIGERPKLE